MQFIFIQVLIKRIKSIRFFMKDKAVPKRKKALVILAALYLVVPFDVVPEPIFFFGIIDDVVLWGTLIYYLKNELDRYWIGEKEVPIEEKFRGKKIVNDVDFQVKTESPAPGEMNASGATTENTGKGVDE